MEASDDWFVSNMEIHNFRNFSNLSMSFAREVTLLVGMNGSGKTAILDALAIMLSTPVRELGGEGRGFLTSDARVLPSSLDSTDRTATAESQYPVAAEIRAVLAGRSFDWERHRSSEAGKTSWGAREVRDFASEMIQQATGSGQQSGAGTTLPVIAYYGIERLLKVRHAHGTIRPSRKHAYASALAPGSDLTRLSGFLESLDHQIVAAQAYGDQEATGAKHQFAAIDMACTRILESVAWSRLRWNQAIGQLTLSHERHGTLPLSYLATGTKIAAGMAIDLASRMARANPHIGAEELLRTTPGIVLIDEVDMHLHPAWQQRIVPALRKTFPRVQFVLTTHSPQVISTVEAENIRILDEDSVVVPPYAQGLRSNVILKEIQGVDPVPREIAVRKDLDRYLELVYGGQASSDEAVSLRRTLDDKLGGAELNEELRQADVHLEFASLEL